MERELIAAPFAGVPFSLPMMLFCTEIFRRYRLVDSVIISDFEDIFTAETLRR